MINRLTNSENYASEISFVSKITFSSISKSIHLKKLKTLLLAFQKHLNETCN